MTDGESCPVVTAIRIDAGGWQGLLVGIQSDQKFYRSDRGRSGSRWLCGDASARLWRLATNAGGAYEIDLVTRRRAPAQKGLAVGQPVVHFEVIGQDPQKLRSFYGGLFGWEFDTAAPVAEAVSQPDDYGFVSRNATPDGVGIPGGVGGGPGHDAHALFYIGVSDVEAALRKAESLGGTRVMGPVEKPGGDLVVAHFRDPEGNLMGLAGPT